MLADFHMHSTYSDGRCTPEELVQNAKRAGVDIMSLTDHDSVAGIDETWAAATAAGITFMPGIEISCHVVGPQGQEVHLLGYNFDHHDETLGLVLNKLQRDRAERLDHIIKALAKLGITIERAAVMQYAKSAYSVGRPHIAQVMVDVGAVADFREAFDKYLGEGKPACVPRRPYPVAEAIRLIHSLGGITSLAHPVHLKSATVQAVMDAGVDALEAYHPDQDWQQQADFVAQAQKARLEVSGGSDFHGSEEVIRPTEHLKRGRQSMGGFLHRLGLQ